MQMKKQGISRKAAVNYIAAIICSAGVAAGIAFVLLRYGLCLQGSALYAQLYRLDIVKAAMQEGSWRPLYAYEWYNGYEIFRYSSPVSYILINTLTSLTGADSYTGLCLFYGIMIWISQMGFFLFGIRQRRMAAAFLTGLAFLFLPSSIYIVIWQGCFDITMGLALIPAVLFFIYDFVRLKNRLALLPFSILLAALILANYILAFAFGIVALIGLAISVLATRSWRFEVTAAANLLLVYAAMGYVLYPALSGGLLTRSYSLLGEQTQPVGIAMLALAVLGLFTADRYRFTGFCIAAAGIFFSFGFMEPVRRLMPFTALRDEYWYLAVISVVFLTTLLCWERLRLVFLVIMLAVVAGESIPRALSMQEGSAAVAVNETAVADYLLDEAADCTDNRLALLDETSLGAFPHWYLASMGVSEMFGWDYENAATIQNQMNINEAFADGLYDYMFDRLLLYGNDTALILKERLIEEGAYDELIAAAGQHGYEPFAENDKAIAFKLSEVSGSYGVISHYDNLAIGTSASYIAYIYPSFGHGRSDCLEDYSIEELENYDILYLSGFTYQDKEQAENMLKELGRKGVRVYIDMQQLPVSRITGKNEFMGVYAQNVQFTDEFPILQNDNGNQFKLNFTTQENEIWNTVYITGCNQIIKEATYRGKDHLIYLGKNTENPNITFMGFNLVYYYLSTHNQDLSRFLNEAFQISPKDLSEHEIVPISIERGVDQLIVHTEADKVNCNIACVDGLSPDRIVSEQENLWVVNQGDTIFRIVYAGYREGMFLSIIGCIGLGILWIAAYVLLENKEKEAEAQE